MLLYGLNLIIDLFSLYVFLSLLHVPVVVLALESISAWLCFSNEFSELSSISGDKLSVAFLSSLASKVFFDKSISEVEAHHSVS